MAGNARQAGDDPPRYGIALNFLYVYLQMEANSASIIPFMKRQGPFHNGYRNTIIALSLAFLAIITTGCATGRWGGNMSSVSRYFDANVDTVWNAVVQATEGTPIETKDKEKGVLRTRWINRWSEDKSMGLLLEGRWQERHRLHVKVTGGKDKTYVSLCAQKEEKAPGGSRAYRWNSAVSDGTLEREFLRKLESILENP